MYRLICSASKALDVTVVMVNSARTRGKQVAESICSDSRCTKQSRRTVRLKGRAGKPRADLWSVLVLAVGLPVSGCTSVSVGTADGQEFAGIGFYRVKLPATQGALVAVDRESVGLGWGSLAGSAGYLGYDKSEWVIADPADCQLLIVIKSAAQAENAKEIIELLGDQSPCIVDQTGSLRPSPRP